MSNVLTNMKFHQMDARGVQFAIYVTEALESSCTQTYNAQMRNLIRAMCLDIQVADSLIGYPEDAC